MVNPTMLESTSVNRDSDLLLPHSMEAEQAVIGAILADSECFIKVVEVIDDSKAFYKKSHQILFDAFIDLTEKNNNIDTITVTEHLRDKGLLEDAGGRGYISALTDHAPIAANAEYYAKTVKGKYLLRKLITAGNDIVELGHQTDLDPNDLIDQAEQMIFGLAESKHKESLSHIGDLVQQTWQIIEEREANKGQLIGVDTGFYDLNAMTAGFQKGDLIILAARPSMGKCLAADSEIVMGDGSVQTIEQIYKSKKARLLTLNKSFKYQITEASDFIDDGIKPVFEVKTKLGKKIRTTITHPFRTIEGWKKLGEIETGEQIAVPRKLDVFGDLEINDSEIKLLGYLIGDGCLTKGCPEFTNSNLEIQEDFIQSVEGFDPALKVKRINPEDSPKVDSFRVSKDREFLVERRTVFSKKLKTIIYKKGFNQRTLAKRVGINNTLINQWCSGSCAPSLENFNKLNEVLEFDFEDSALQEVEGIRGSSKNSLTRLLESYGLMGKGSHNKFVPPQVFKLRKRQIALFLNRLFATDGWACVLASGQSQLGFASVSERLAREVQHLLLRFGVIASLKKRRVKYKDDYREAWQLDITHQDSIRTFIEEIGIFGKEGAVQDVQEAISTKNNQTNTDLVPMSVWNYIEASKGSESWQSLAQRAEIKGYTNIHPYKRCPSRKRLQALGKALKDGELMDLAQSEVYWDEIVSIEYIGDEQVYDLTIPDTHNFVANDISVHNTAMCLNIAEATAMKDKKPVAVFSLEMSKEQVVQRMLCSRAQVDSNRIRTGQVYPEDWQRLGQAMSEIGEAPIFIDDSPGLTVMELRGKCRRLKAEHGDLGLVIIDYMQLMQGRSNESRINQISEISRNLKMLARELEVPIMALSQLSRAVEARQDKHPMLSDLRESGSIEQDSDVVMFVYRDEYYHPETERPGMADIIVAKQRSGPVGTLELLFQSNITRFRNPVKDSSTDN